ncbi:hypothetical protein [Rouxiella sp. WC2420]|uniref:Uncharacterized protein n=1 Tax=Rouxiella sp. WC2420 TaxID=3234145 RepID=A0AB39VUN6_9GAMM
MTDIPVNNYPSVILSISSGTVLPAKPLIESSASFSNLGEHIIQVSQNQKMPTSCLIDAGRKESYQYLATCELKEFESHSNYVRRLKINYPHLKVVDFSIISGCHVNTIGRLAEFKKMLNQYY